jgi:hypothetical protein
VDLDSKIKPFSKCPACRGAVHGDGTLEIGPRWFMALKAGGTPGILEDSYSALRYSCNRCGYAVVVPAANG